ncbi:Kelch repeat-containing protein 3 [Microsporum ferrugineum]
MAKDKKAKKAEQKARAAAKQSKKASQKEKKAKAKGLNDDSDAEDVDLDAVLAAYAEEQAKFLKVTEVASGIPSPRSSATIIASPSNRGEIFLFGGEYFDGSLATFYNNLYVYLIEKNEWRMVTSPNSPLPRSGHAWCRGGNAGGIYLFGDPSTREWTRIETKSKGPPARSGHRMTYYKNYIILFGGFQDTSQQTKYLQDVWLYDCQKFTWYNPALPPATQKPDARSSFSFLPHESGAVLFGGYSRVKAAVKVSKGQKGGSSAQRAVLKPVIHQDTWFLRVTPPPADAPSTASPTIRWEKRKRPVNAPNPPRAGVTMAYHKGRGILFGGVHDVEATEEGIESEFFDNLFAWNIERNRFFPLPLRAPKSAGKKQQATERAMKSRNKGKADEEELLRNLALLEAKANPSKAEAEVQVETGEIDEDEPESGGKKSLPVRLEMPHRRFNTQLTVQEDTLFMYGGTFERGDQEFTLCDMYSIDLLKMDGVREIFCEEPEHWNDAIAPDSDEEEDDDDEDEDEDEDEDLEGSSSIGAPSTAATELTEPTPMEVDAEKEEEPEPTVVDSRPHPRPFESLREFYSRSSTEWQDIVLAKLREQDSGAEMSVKELRKVAFDLAEDKWWDCREEITALEDEQAEAGIGEVVSMASRDSGPRRR